VAANTTSQSFTDMSFGGSKRAGVFIALLSVYLIWGSTYLGIAVALESFPPVVLGVTRFALSAAILFFALLVVRREPLPTPRQMLNAMLIGVLTLGIGTTAVAFAEQHVSSGLAALAVAATPLWTAAFSFMLFKRPTRLEWVGLLVGFSGILLLNLDKGLSGQPQGALPLIIGPVCWSFGSILSKRLDMPKGFMAIAFECLGAMLMMAALMLISGDRLPANPSTSSVLAIVYLATFGSLIGFTAYIYLLDNVRPAIATSYAYVNPIVALALGVLLLAEGDSVTPLMIVAMAVILGGVILVGYAAGRGQKRPASS